MFRLLLVAVLILNFNLAQAQVSLDRIVAVVNDEVVTQSQLDLAMDQMRKQIAQNNMPDPGDAELRQIALNQLIDQSLELQLAEKAKLSVSPEELQKAVQSIAEQNHLSITELKEKISNESGMNYAEFQQQIKQQILITKLQQMALGPKIDITESQVNKAVAEARAQQQQFSEYNITDILIPLPENPTAAQVQEAKTRANELIKQLKAGKSVAELTTIVEETSSNEPKKPGFFARLFKSETSLQKEQEEAKGPSPEQISAQDLGLRKETDLPQVFAAQLNNLRANGVAGPIQTGNGLHILRLNEIKAPTLAPIDRNQIRAQLYQQAILKELPNWVKQIRKTAYIKIN